MSMKNSSDTIWNRTSDLPICSAAIVKIIKNSLKIGFCLEMVVTVGGVDGTIC
jgi:hypothetical protein